MICMPIGNPARVKPHGTLIAGMPNTLNGSVLRISEGSPRGIREHFLDRLRQRHARRRDEHVDVGEDVVDRVARDLHLPALLDVDLRRDARAAHDALQRQRVVQRALRGVREQRRVIRVRLGVEQRVRVGRCDRHVARRAP